MTKKNVQVIIDLAYTPIESAEDERLNQEMIKSLNEKLAEFVDTINSMPTLEVIETSISAPGLRVLPE